MKKAVKTFAFICLTLFGSICAFTAPFEATVVSAKGKTVITDIEYILRGYENLEEKLTKLGANIYKEEGE